MHQIELLAFRNHKTNGMAICLKPKVPYIITPSLAHEIRVQQNKIAEEYYVNPWDDVFYLLWYLHAGSMPWNGLDFKYIYDSLISHNETAMEKYIEEIFDLLFINYVGFDLPIITCSILNRKLSGISQDFFYLNRLNFIKHYDNNNCVNGDRMSCNKLDFSTEMKKASFPNKIYLRNTYYKFNSIDFDSMRRIIGSYKHIPISREDQIKIKLIFDALAEDTIARIYHLASKNINVIARFAEVQSTGIK